MPLKVGLRPRWIRPQSGTTVADATTVVAASRRLSPEKDRYGSRNGNDALLCDWQQEAWAHYDECGQLRYMVNLAADMMSRSRLFITKLDDDGKPMEEPPEGPDAGELPAVFGGPTIQKGLLHAFGIQLGVVGDSWLIGEEEKDAAGKPTGRERWQVCSLEEFYRDAQGWWIDNGGSSKKRQLDPETTAVIRVWKPHPRRREEADSQVKANRRPLRILSRLAKYMTAILDSRLAGPGILLMPKEMTFAVAGQQSANDNSGASKFLELLEETMVTAIQNPDGPEAVVPIVVMGPAEHLKEARLLTMNTPLTENMEKIEQQAIKSLALGLDAPPEMLLGLADTNHWSAWQLEEATVKFVVEPLLELVCGAITEQFLWPALEDKVADAEEWLIWYETTELTDRPDKAQDAKDVFDKGELNGSALRRETGFGDSDAPSAAERELNYLMKLAAAVPAVAAQVAPRMLELIVQVSEVDGQKAPGAQITTVEDPQQRQLEAQQEAAKAQAEAQQQNGGNPNDGRGLPQQDQNASQASVSGPMLAACETVALAIMRRANNRNAKRQRHQFPGEPAERLHLHVPVLDVKVAELLEGSREDVARLARTIELDPAELQTAVCGYVAVTLTAGLEHDAERLRDHLATVVCRDQPSG